MLKRLCKKKFIICFVAIFALFLVYLIPNDNHKLNTKIEIEYVNSNVKTSDIYLLDGNNYLAKTKIEIKSDDPKKKSLELLESLIIDSKKQDNIPSGFKAIIPPNTKINSVNINDGLIKIDISDEALNISKENEEKMIEAIVYTLTSIEEINNVIIYIDGQILTKLQQTKINLPSTLNKEFGINKEYNLSNSKNINKTTIYYIGEYNDNTYYIPVTKVNNDERNKIEIIIDELSSSNVYKPNLMSYLNNNTEILSVNEENDTLTINFNDAIFNDINTKEILEEVIYTLSLSINDNYNIKEIVFNVENQEIYKSVNKTLE